MFPAWFPRIAAMVAVLLAALLAAAPAHAQAGLAGTELPVCVKQDRGGMDPAALIRDPAGFDCTTSQEKLGAGSYWAVSREIDRISSPETPLSVRFASVWQKGIALHVLYADGRIATVNTDRRGITPFIQLGAVAEMPLPHSDAPVVRLMWHVEEAANVRGVVLGARVTTEDESRWANLKMAALFAAFGGLTLGLLIYNLALWGALRHRFQLWYCAMAAGLLAYAFSTSGTLAWVWPEIVNNDRLRLNYLLLGLLGGAAMMFARTFFEERVFAGWLGKLATADAIAMAGAGLFVFLAAPLSIRTADLIFSTMFLGIAGVVVPTLWRAWRLRSNYLWLFAIAWGAPILTAVLRVLGNLHILPWNFWLDNSTILSMTAEALLSSLAIAYRIKLLSIERDAAVRGEEMARRLAETDPLTGLLNRRAFLEKAIGREDEQMLQIADLDHFKRVNETLGHDGGDEVLRVFARVLRQVAPADALVARMGGEEFAILCRRDKSVEPEIVLARLRAARMPFDLQITTSIGTCCGPILTEPDWKQLYRGADAALFEAKSAGRDRVRNAPAREAA